jgi:hypothetical protein
MVREEYRRAVVLTEFRKMITVILDIQRVRKAFSAEGMTYARGRRYSLYKQHGRLYGKVSQPPHC